MHKLIYTAILLISFGIVNAQEIDNLIQKVEPVFCDCVEKIDAYEGLDDLGNKLKKCNSAYKLSKSDSLLIENVGYSEYQNKIFKTLRSNCCEFKKIFAEVSQQSIEKKKLKQVEIDSIKTKALIGNSLADNKSHFNFVSESIKIKVTDIKKDSCGFPTHIFASSNGVTFRISTLFDNKIMITEDEYVLSGKIRDNADGLFITSEDVKEPYFFVFNAINLGTLEMKGLK